MQLLATNATKKNSKTKSYRVVEKLRRFEMLPEALGKKGLQITSYSELINFCCYIY